MVYGFLHGFVATVDCAPQPMWPNASPEVLGGRPASTGITSKDEASLAGLPMTLILGKSRAFLVRCVAVVTLILTYLFGNIAPVLTAAGITAFSVTATVTPANARRYRRRRFYGYWPYRRWRRVSPL